MLTDEEELNLAFEPTPLAKPADRPEPAKVTADPVEMTTSRMTQFVESAMRTDNPSAVISTPEGEENFAFVPSPFVDPKVVTPAKVVTEAVEMSILRMR
jgi:hypothetical protein